MKRAQLQQTLLHGADYVSLRMQARFSTVLHPRGSPESLRDVRGFTVRFQTDQGNWDLVGNNMPVFFVRDGMKFVDMVHALKPNPMTHEQARPFSTHLHGVDD